MATDDAKDNRVAELIALAAAQLAIEIVQKEGAHPAAAIHGLSAALASTTFSVSLPGKEAAAMIHAINRLTRDTTALLGDKDAMRQKAANDAIDLLDMARRAQKGGQNG